VSSKFLSQPLLIEESVKNNLGSFSETGALIVNTGAHTGRAAKNRFVAKNSTSEKTVSWGSANVAIAQTTFETIFQKTKAKLEASSKSTYQYRGFVGAFPITVHSFSPWHIAFAANMFREEIIPEFKNINQVNSQPIEVVHDPYGKVSESGIKLESETLIALDVVSKKVVIVGTAYAGEIKKSAFSLCNYLLPELGIMPMHSSANCLEDGSNSSVLFGLSGTGKTTLSATADRWLIGDDEIVWSEQGLSNLEGGCYAKLIDLDPKKEPEIFSAVNKFGSIMENVGFDLESRTVQFADRSRTENTRGSYPLSSLTKVFNQNKQAEAPKTIVFLTADAFGAMPAVARLNPWQAQYYFVSGYTAKVAGTEIGVKEPQAAFSTCFGAPFMPRSSQTYASLLAKLIEKNNTSVWILNTGWMSGGYGKGERFPIAVSRGILSAIQSGELAKQKVVKHPKFGFEVPTSCPGLDSKFLDVSDTQASEGLVQKFKKNFETFASQMDSRVAELGGP
jgi:phosphoenolpyruvate carboxykinase (ATP)